MPNSVKTICSYPGCPTLTLGGRCDKHKHVGKKKRRSSSAMGYDRKWQGIRAKYLVDNPICELQTHCSGSRATQVDHIKPLRQGGTNARSNLQGACRRCHSAKTAGEMRRDKGRFA